MLRLRPYRKSDAERIVSWLKDEESFRKWSADRYERYPVTADDINQNYEACEAAGEFYEMTAFDEDGICGHFILRFTDKELLHLRLGFVIVDDEKRGRGYGREMMRLALEYGFRVLKASEISIVVFDNNPAAIRCYEAAGFRKAEYQKDCLTYQDQKWSAYKLIICAEEYCACNAEL